MHPDVDGYVVTLVDVERGLHLGGREIETGEDLLEM
jgi:hypothetical protein